MIYRQPVTGVLYRSNFESSFALARCRARIAQMPIRNNSILRLWNGLSAATLISECNLSSAASEKDRDPPGQTWWARGLHAWNFRLSSEETDGRMQQEETGEEKESDGSR